MPTRQPPNDDHDAHLTDLHLQLIRQHRILASLTTIRGLAQLLSRRADRFGGLEDDQRAWLVACGTRIDQAATSLLEQIASMPGDSTASGVATGADED